MSQNIVRTNQAAIRHRMTIAASLLKTGGSIPVNISPDGSIWLTLSLVVKLYWIDWFLNKLPVNSRVIN